jgi:hypothetical protein
MTDDEERRQLEHVCAELVREFTGRLSPDDVEWQFRQIVAGFDGAPVRTFVPVLAHKRAREVLRPGPGAMRVVQLP